MINNDFILANLQEAIYTLKEGTASSYYWQSGTRILPNRLSISRKYEMTKVKKQGRNLLDPVVGQMIGNFTKDETSYLKRFAPYCVRTQIWKDYNFPLLIGYGTTGITDTTAPRRFYDTQDLLAFYSDDEWRSIHIFFISKMGMPEYKDVALQCVQDLITKQNM